MVVKDDDVDLESLQAQIDMSISFAHNLVTSWIKPTYLANLRSSNVNATQMLEDELRRPPRLGVGAPIPAVLPLAREASKLKHRLEKSGSKNEGSIESQSQDSSKPDHEEHKGRPIKRKTKVDPFGHEGSKKKRKAESTINSNPSPGSISKHSISLVNTPAEGSLTTHKKRRVRPGDQQSHMNGRPSPPVKLPAQATLSPSLISLSLSEPSRGASAPDTGGLATPKSIRMHTNSMPIPDKAKPLGIPLLNLDGPPELTDKPGNTNESHNSRKRRKRRKKKKKYLVASTGET